MLDRRIRRITSYSARVNPYEILGIEPSATPGEIKAAYRRRLHETHPDSRTHNSPDFDIDAVVAAYAEVMRPISIETPTARPVDGDYAEFSMPILPVEAFELLILASSWLGDPYDTDPPYALSVLWTEEPPGYVHIDLEPTAGATTVVVRTSERLRDVSPPTAARASRQLQAALAELGPA